MTRAGKAVTFGPCIACGTGDWAPLHAALRDYITAEAFDVVRCSECGLGMTVPAPPPSELARYYPQQYRGNRHAGTGSFRSRRRAAAVGRHFPPGFRGRLLDLGAGAGDFAVLMRRQGWEVAATELDAQPVQALRERGIDARLPAHLEDADWQNCFDAVTCWHVLEHVNDPPAVLEQARRALAPRGILQVTLPNLASWQARAMGRHWFHLDLPRHLFHFTPAALDRLLGRAGFAVVARSTFALEYDWFGAIQSPLNALLPRQNVLFDSLTRARGQRSAAQVAASYALAPVVGTAAILPVMASALAAAGATLSYTCQATESTADI